MTATLRGSVEATGAAAVRTRYFVRPGRRAIVITGLADLHGPADGTVTLPLWLYRSGPSPAFDLGVPSMWRWLYEIVLREAAGPADLTRFLDRDMLIAQWPQRRRLSWLSHHHRKQTEADRRVDSAAEEKDLVLDERGGRCR